VISTIVSILGAIAGTALIGLIAGDGSKMTKLVVASVTLASSVLGSVAAFFKQSVAGGDRVQLFAELQQNAGEAAGLALYLEIWSKTPAPRPALDPQAIARAQELVAALRRHVEGL
jgi:hypothetical protein